MNALLRKILFRRSPDEQALRWHIALLDETDIPQRKWIAFMGWLSSDPRHEAAFARYEHVLDEVKGLKDDPAFVLDTLDAGLGQDKSAGRRMPRFEWSRKYALAAAAVLLVLSGAYYGMSPETYITGRGQQLWIPMSDGSLMTLNTDSEADVTYLPWRRTVSLNHGEAYFVVAHDGSRPFFVKAGAGKVRSIGTKFGVRMQNGSATVSLVEGNVLVQTDGRADGKEGLQTQALFAGQALKYDQSGRQQLVNAADVNALNDWTQGRLNFTSARLEDIVAELNRYNTKQILIAETDLRDQKISAYFNIGQLDNFLSALNDWFEIAHYNRDSKTIVLYRKARSV